MTWNWYCNSYLISWKIEEYCLDMNRYLLSKRYWMLRQINKHGSFNLTVTSIKNQKLDIERIEIANKTVQTHPFCKQLMCFFSTTARGCIVPTWEVDIYSYTARCFFFCREGVKFVSHFLTQAFPISYFTLKLQRLLHIVSSFPIIFKLSHTATYWRTTNFLICF